MKEEKDLTEQGSDMGEKCGDKSRHLFDSQSDVPWLDVQDWNTLRLVFLFFLTLEKK